MRHVDAPKPQYEKRGEREAARMNMLLRQGGFGASCAKSPKWCTPVSKEDKIAQLAQFSLGGRGKKFCGNLPRNLKAVQAGGCGKIK